MIYLDKFVTNLCTNYLINTVYVDDVDKTTYKSSYFNNIKYAINTSLKYFYTKYIISQKQLLLETRTPYVYYYLRPEFAKSNTESVVPFKYIIDTPEEPFLGNLIRVLMVYFGDRPLPMDDLNDNNSIFLVQSDCLQITDVHSKERISRFSVVYQEQHREVSNITETILSKPDLIEIPVYLEECLYLYTSFKLLTALNNTDLNVKAQEYYANCVSMFAELEKEGLLKKPEFYFNNKFYERGFL
jgi:hypothetical protein